MTTVPDRINGDLSRFVCGVYCWTERNNCLWTEPWRLHLFWLIIEEINLFFKIPGLFKNIYWACAIYFMLHFLSSTTFVHKYNRILKVDTFISLGRSAIMLILYCLCKYGMLTTEEDYRSAIWAFYNSYTTYTNSTPENESTGDAADNATIEANATFTLPNYLVKEDIAGFENQTEGTLKTYLKRNTYEFAVKDFAPTRHCATWSWPNWFLGYPHPNEPTAQVLDYMEVNNANFTKSEIMRAFGGSDYTKKSSTDLVLAFVENKDMICKRLTACGMDKLRVFTENAANAAANGGTFKPGIIQWLNTVIWESKGFETESVLTFFFMFLLAFLLFVQRKR